jgi:ornithine lipid ester-linked acyl 2-hydroxylase
MVDAGFMAYSSSSAPPRLLTDLRSLLNAAYRVDSGWQMSQAGQGELPEMDGMSNASGLRRGVALGLAVALGRVVRIPVEYWIQRASLVGTQPFLETDSFEWIRTLEDAWPEIRAEYDTIRQEGIPNIQDISVLQRYLTTDNRWKSYFFYGYGFKVEANCKRCPVTTQLLESIPGMKTAFFSVLLPGKVIPPHRGPFRGLLRYHLAVKVPSPENACAIRVGGIEETWREGKSLLFDDTYVHEAWNKADSERVVLFVDVMRPMTRGAATFAEVFMNVMAKSPYVRDAKRRHIAWEASQRGQG